MGSIDMAPTSSALVPDWASLPADILGMIMDKLVDISDRVRASAVCKSWLSTFQDTNYNKEWLNPGATQLPMLLIPTEDSSETHRGLFSVAEGRTTQTRLHVPYNKRCCGSSHGWLVYAEALAEPDIGLTLLNPFSGETIQLPPVAPPWTSGYGPEHDIRKVILSKDPSLAPDDYEVLALCGFNDTRSLALFKAGGKSWIYTKDEDNESGGWFEAFQDITYFRGCYFAVSPRHMVLLEPEPEGGAIELRTIIRQPSKAAISYVVGCGDVLMWIRRHYVQSEYEGDDAEDDPNYDEGDDAEDDPNYDEEDDDEGDDAEVYSNYGDGLGKESNTGYFEIDGKIYGYDLCIHHLTLSFEVCRLVVKEREIEAVDTRHLEGHALFLGNNQACLVMASDFPGCMPDSIYYMDDAVDIAYQPLGAIDSGVFSLEDQRSRPLYVPQFHLPPPIWILPKATTRTNVQLLSD